MSSSAVILIADDNPIIRERLRYSIARFYGETPAAPQIHEAENGLKALQFLSIYTTDLMICDCDMPVLDGLELISKVRAPGDRPRLKILAMAANRCQSEARCLAAGADCFLEKPLRLAAVLAAFATLLARPAGTSPELPWGEMERQL